MPNLDRFSQDPSGAAATIIRNLARKAEEPNTCVWCEKPISTDRRICLECEFADKICQMSFGAFIEYLQAEAENPETTIAYDGGYLEIHWLFDTEYEAEKIARILKSREAKYIHSGKSVLFYIGVDRHGRLDVMES
ncbi:MAG: hypothetical protein A4E55_00350 [Pelotomaculum sp. PtaU1.Bin035]|nr:MAG: hypothetical protein A4E55_00350 [Pelotomaculum sp. PtaU1.Bin035]